MTQDQGAIRLCLDPTRCAGGGACCAAQPDRFRRDAGGATELARAEILVSELAELREVVLACPSGALRIDGDPLYDFPNVGP